MKKDTIAGKVKEMGGKTRANIAKVTGDEEGEARGRTDQLTGSIQKNYGKLKDSLS